MAWPFLLRVLFYYKLWQLRNITHFSRRKKMPFQTRSARKAGLLWDLTVDSGPPASDQGVEELRDGPVHLCRVPLL
uniref:Uncharacterized protein n=1 Tax=Anguilla anguilla TaxID=7936 RepID=A0A0E9XJJ1_ANGAN